ncbi:hypothetical protein [Roseivirga pacifica]|uniref:hypothetical protein n=1 Tax=Roseivirga pacifica TaxID=1267423 RepID=UPI00227B277C|nr:hypothetical protein [Roseivirga pacifica]
MKNTLIISLAVFTIWCLTSCEGNQTTETTAKSYKAVVADSVVFKTLPEVELLDYNKQSKELMLHDRQSNEVVIINQQGEEISRFNPHIEGPNYAGDRTFGWTFFGEDMVVGYGHFYFHLMTKQGERIKRIPYPVRNKQWATLDYYPKMIFSSTAGQAEIIVLIPGVENINTRSQAYQDTVKMVYKVNLNSEEGTPVMHKTPDGLYRSLGAHTDQGFPSMIAIEKGKVAQIYPSDDKIYMWDTEQDELVTKLEIPEPHKPVFDQIPFDKKGTPDHLKVNSKIYHTKNQIVLVSLDKVPESAIDQLSKTVPRWWESEELEQLKKRYFKVNLLLFSEEGFLGEVNTDGLGEYVFYNGESTNEDFFWVQRTYSDERDYRTFLKVTIVED